MATGLKAVITRPNIELSQSGTGAVTSADMPMMLDDNPVDCWSAFDAQTHQTLSFGFLKTGARVYVAVSGDIATNPDLGRRSTCPIGARGGVERRTSAVGDVILIKHSQRTTAAVALATAIPASAFAQDAWFPDEAEKVKPAFFPWHCA